MIQNKVDYPKIAKLSEDFRDTFDVRKISSWQTLCYSEVKGYYTKAQVFIYQNDLINYTVVDLGIPLLPIKIECK